MKVPSCILDPYVRRRAKLSETPLSRYKVRVARTYEEHEAAFRLLHVAYVFQGIEPVDGQAHGLRITEHHVLPEATLLLAYEDDVLVGTMTVTLDSPAGLPLEHDYAQQVAALRERGARIVEYGSLAVVRRCWHSGVTALLAMAAHWLSLHIYDATHCVIGINPKAAPVYRALFAFHPLGAARDHATLRAPVLGMVQDFDEALAHFVRYHRRPMESGILPHEHFCEELPPCIEMPTLNSLPELVRWKLPRAVFRRLFIDRSDRLVTLDTRTRAYLSNWRSFRTLAVATLAS